MLKKESSVLFIEIQKYPYYGRFDETKEYLSEKICRYIIKARKKTVRKTKQIVFCTQLAFSLSNELTPTQAIGLPILP